MDLEKDDTHIDNLLELFGAKPEKSAEETNVRGEYPNAWRGRTNQISDTKKTPTHAQNQAAAKAIVSEAANTLGNMELGELDPRQLAYAPGAVLGAKYGPQIANTFDPLVAKERELDRIRRWQAVLPNETQQQYESRMKLPGASGARNYANVMPGQQMPEAVLQTVEDMTKGNPRGMGAYDVAARDAANLAKINAMGGSHYELTGEGLPAKTPKPFQLMMPHGQQISSTATTANAIPKAASQSKLLAMLKAFPEYTSMILSNPVIKSSLHGANILGTAVQGATDVYNKDPVGGLITAGQVAGSLAGFPEVAIPAAELARYARTREELPEPKKPFINRRFGLD